MSPKKHESGAAKKDVLERIADAISAECSPSEFCAGEIERWNSTASTENDVHIICLYPELRI